MMVGGIIGPGLESVMVSLAGVRVVPLVIASFAALDLVVSRAPGALRRWSKRCLRTYW